MTDASVIDDLVMVRWNIIASKERALVSSSSSRSICSLRCRNSSCSASRSHTVSYPRRLQLYDSTRIRLLFDGHSTAYQMSLNVTAT